MRKLLALAVVLALVAGATWWSFRMDALAQPPHPNVPPTAAPEPPAVVAASVAAPSVAASVAPADSAIPERTAAPPAEPARPEHTLRGRAVDASGQPLAGINASLLGWVGNSQRLAEWAKNNAEPERIDQRVTTGPDGVFTFRCWPPPPFQFSLRLQGSGVAAWGQRWNDWAPGGTTDLGDVKLERGTLLRGRVVDSVGAPVAKVEVRVDGARARAPGGAFETWSTARTGDDGAFVQRWPLVAGDYKLGIDDQMIERGDKVTLAGEPEQVIEVVCKRVDPSEAISGVVVDETGAPLRGVSVHGTAGSGRLITTDAEGRFRVLKRDGAPAETSLFVMKRGYEAAPSQETYAWGRHDVRIVMTRGKDLAVLVVRAADGAPVENYVLRVIPIGGGWNSMDREPRGQPPHEEGRASVAGIKVGKHRVLVEPQGDQLALGVAQIEVGPNGAPPVTVRLAMTQPRVVRVVAADGTPVPGAKVQLVDTCGEPWNKDVLVFSLASQVLTSGPQALELAAATTDASGDCTLPVPGDRPLALMLPGPGHTALAVQSAAFPADGPLVITVSRGAVLRGQIGPGAAWAELKRLGGADGALPEGFGLPSLSLQRGEGRTTETFPGFFDSRRTVNADGSFELTGIPPGRWRISLQYTNRQAGDRHGNASKQEAMGDVDLVDGQVTTIAPDLSGVMPGTLEVLVVHDGAPLANILVNFERSTPGASWQFEDALNTDAEGRVRLSARQGEYRAAWAAASGQGWSSLLRSAETAVVRVGETTRQTFTIVSSTLKVRLVDSKGTPVANVRLMLEDADAQSALTPTNADGRIEQKLAPGTYTTFVLPKRLQDPKALAEFYRTMTDGTAMQRARVVLGTVTVLAGAASEIELKLPADW